MIVKHDKTNITITKSNIDDIELKNGYIVHRHLMDGDYVYLIVNHLFIK